MALCAGGMARPAVRPAKRKRPACQTDDSTWLEIGRNILGDTLKDLPRPLVVFTPCAGIHTAKLALLEFAVRTECITMDIDRELRA